MFYKGRALECRPFMKDSRLQKFKDEYNRRRVYIYNVDPRMSDGEVTQLFAREVGPVENAYCIRNNGKKGKKRGLIFGFVLFEEQADAERAVRREFFRFGRDTIKVKKFKKKGDVDLGRIKENAQKQKLSRQGDSYPYHKEQPVRPRPHRHSEFPKNMKKAKKRRKQRLNEFSQYQPPYSTYREPRPFHGLGHAPRDHLLFNSAPEPRQTYHLGSPEPRQGYALPFESYSGSRNLPSSYYYPDQIQAYRTQLKTHKSIFPRNPRLLANFRVFQQEIQQFYQQFQQVPYKRLNGHLADGFVKEKFQFYMTVSKQTLTTDFPILVNHDHSNIRFNCSENDFQLESERYEESEIFEGRQTRAPEFIGDDGFYVGHRGSSSHQYGGNFKRKFDDGNYKGFFDDGNYKGNFEGKYDKLGVGNNAYFGATRNQTGFAGSNYPECLPEYTKFNDAAVRGRDYPRLLKYDHMKQK
jgi:hypothetical protein